MSFRRRVWLARSASIAGVLVLACGSRSFVSSAGQAGDEAGSGGHSGGSVWGGGGFAGNGNCCAPTSVPGCQDAGVEACVCDEDAYCCSFSWDESCVETVEVQGCGTCSGSGGVSGTGGSVGGRGGSGGFGAAGGLPLGGSMPTGGLAGAPPGGAAGSPPTGDCCEITPWAAGCSIPSVESCVCASDAYCCEYNWDEFCVSYASNCGACGGGTGGTSGNGGAPTGGTGAVGGSAGQGNCCVSTPDIPGCSSPAVADCVCSFDRYCCSFAWDLQCVTEGRQSCGSCGTGGAGGTGGVGGSGGVTSGGTGALGATGGSGGSQTGGTGAGGSSGSGGLTTGGTGATGGSSGSGGLATGGVGGSGGSPGGGTGGLPGQGSCCTGTAVPGCLDASVSECVCSVDPYCCTNRWDDVCVRQVQSLGCGSCVSLIDDMEDGDEVINRIGGRDGSWYAFADDTGGVLSPGVGVLYPAPIDDGRAGSTYAMAIWGYGFTSWSAGMGFSMTAQGLPYTAAAFSGLAFWARVEPNTATTIRVNVLDRWTVPEGGWCGECYDHFGKSFVLSTSWARYTLSWDELTQQGGGDARPKVDETALYGVEFLYGTGASFQLYVDDVAFL